MTSLQIPIWKDMMNSTSELPLRELPLSASHIPSLPGRWANADDYFEHEDFLDIFDFNTQAAANLLGTAVSEMSSQIFRKLNARSEPMKEIKAGRKEPKL